MYTQGVHKKYTTLENAYISSFKSLVEQIIPLNRKKNDMTLQTGAKHISSCELHCFYIYL